MTEYCILSPHCDDAMLALGGHILLNPNKFKIINIFATTAWTALNRPLTAVEITQLNQAEERLVARMARSELRLIKTPEALMRGYKQWDEANIKSSDKLLMSNLWDKISKNLHNYSRVYCPLAPGRHVDHLLLRQAVTNHISDLLDAGVEVYFFEDLPYSWYGGVEEELEELRSWLQLTPQDCDISSVLDDKIKLLSQYRSQLTQSDLDKVRQYASMLVDEGMVERVWRLQIK